MPDARILCGAGNDVTTEGHKTDRDSVNILTPPYLYDAAGNLATRPQLLGWTKTAALGQWIQLQTDVEVDEVVLMRPGSVTHGFNPEQRYVPLARITPRGVLHAYYRIPAAADSVPPGDYLLFALKGKVPAIAQWVRITNAAFAPSAAGKITDLSVVCPLAGGFEVSWTATVHPLDNNPGGVEYELRRRVGTAIDTTNLSTTTQINGPAPLTPGATEVWSGGATTAGTRYYYRIRTRSTSAASSLWSPWSASVNALAEEEADCTPGTSGGSGGGGGYRATRVLSATRTTSGPATTNSNTLLDGALDGVPMRDVMPVRGGVEQVEGRSHLWVRQSGHRTTRIDQVRLRVVDHAPGDEAVASDSGVSVGHRVAATAITRMTSDGTSIAVPVGSTFVGLPGDLVTVELAGAPTSPLLFTGKGSYEASDDTSGFLVQVPDGAGGWTDLSRQTLRSRSEDECVPVPAATQVRLAIKGATTFTFIGRLEPSGVAATHHSLAADSLAHSGDGDVSSAFAAGGAGAVLTPGQGLDAYFTAPAEVEGMVRDWFLDVAGVHPGSRAGAGGYASLPFAAPQLPLVFALSQNHPNPFSGSTSIRMALPTAGEVRLEVFDLLGRRVATLAKGHRAAGYHSIAWDRRSERGQPAPAGIYMYRMRAGAFVAERKIVVMP